MIHGSSDSLTRTDCSSWITEWTELSAYSQELSQEGKELAGDDPYMVQMGSVKELVLFSPDQLQDYLHKAEQGSISCGKAGLDRIVDYIL